MSKHFLLLKAAFIVSLCSLSCQDKSSPQAETNSSTSNNDAPTANLAVPTTVNIDSALQVINMGVRLYGDLTTSADFKTGFLRVVNTLTGINLGLPVEDINQILKTKLTEIKNEVKLVSAKIDKLDTKVNELNNSLDNLTLYIQKTNLESSIRELVLLSQKISSEWNTFSDRLEAGTLTADLLTQYRSSIARDINLTMQRMYALLNPNVPGNIYALAGPLLDTQIKIACENIGYQRIRWIEVKDYNAILNSANQPTQRILELFIPVYKAVLSSWATGFALLQASGAGLDNATNIRNRLTDFNQMSNIMMGSLIKLGEKDDIIWKSKSLTASISDYCNKNYLGPTSGGGICYRGSYADQFANLTPANYTSGRIPLFQMFPIPQNQYGSEYMAPVSWISTALDRAGTMPSLSWEEWTTKTSCSYSSQLAIATALESYFTDNELGLPRNSNRSNCLFPAFDGLSFEFGTVLAPGKITPSILAPDCTIPQLRGFGVSSSYSNSLAANAPLPNLKPAYIRIKNVIWEASKEFIFAVANTNYPDNIIPTLSPWPNLACDDNMNCTSNGTRISKDNFWKGCGAWKINLSQRSCGVIPPPNCVTCTTPCPSGNCALACPIDTAEIISDYQVAGVSPKTLEGRNYWTLDTLNAGTIDKYCPGYKNLP